MNYLKRGLKNTYQAIKKHKLLFFSLIILQIILIVVTSMVTLEYQIKILDNTKGIMEPIEQGNYDSTSIQEGELFTQDTLKIYQSYRSLTKNLLHYCLWILGIFIIFNGGLWILVHSFFERKNFHETMHAYLKFFFSTIISIIPFFIIAYYFLKKMVEEISVTNVSQLIQNTSYALIIVYFFLLIAFAFIDVRSWKLFFKKWFKVGIKNIHKSISVLLINLTLILGSGYLIYRYLYEETFFLMILFSALFVIILVLTKIFWIACLKEIGKN